MAVQVTFTKVVRETKNFPYDTVKRGQSIGQIIDEWLHDAIMDGQEVSEIKIVIDPDTWQNVIS